MLAWEYLSEVHGVTYGRGMFNTIFSVTEETKKKCDSRDGSCLAVRRYDTDVEKNTTGRGVTQK